MLDFHKEMFDFYSDHVNLSASELENLRNFRDTNIERLNNGLEKLGFPKPVRVVNQGSYAMNTMTQYDSNEYDIDISIIFNKADLPETPYNARKRIENAMIEAGGNFKKPPECRTNAVTVWYQDGYHVDLAVHRTYTELWGKDVIEHAGVEWKKRDPMEITNWFNESVNTNSPKKENGADVPDRQMKRIVQLIKSYSKSRLSWNLPGGLIISVLVSETYVPDEGSDERSLRKTLYALNQRLQYSTEVLNPVDSTQALTYKTEYQNQVKRFQENLESALKWLESIDDSNEDKEIAAKAWSDFFAHGYWSDLLSSIQGAKSLGENLRLGTYVKPNGTVTSEKPEGNYVKTRPHKYYGKD
jgi:hypothetical protein